MKTLPCKFCARGGCKRGTSCTFSHIDNGGSRQTQDSDSTPRVTTIRNSWRPTAPIFQPKREEEAKGDQNPPSCIYFSKGYCRNGGNCRYHHDTAPPTASSNQEMLLCQAISHLKLDDTCARVFRGAEVVFGPGAEVARLLLPTDFSTIQLSGLHQSCTVEFVREMLSNFSFEVEASNIRLKAIENGGIVAQIKVQDPLFAKNILRKVSTDLDGLHGELQMKEIHTGNKSGASANRVQESFVNCTWYKASCSAWLYYLTEGQVQAALDLLKRQNELLERKIYSNSQKYLIRRGKRNCWSVQLANLHPSTKKYQLEEIFGTSRPMEITIGPPSHSLSDENAENTVRRQLDKYSLETWGPIHTTTAKTKAVARFETREKANEAVQQLNGKTIPGVHKFTVFLSVVCSVKFSVLKETFRATRSDLKALQSRLDSNNSRRLIMYPLADPSQRYTFLRVTGSSMKDVAGLKTEVDQILRGVEAMTEKIPTWDPFFLTAEGLAFLKELHEQSNVHIYRDARKFRLIMYGSSSEMANVNEQLSAKVKELSELVHSITLDTNLLLQALKGGWQEIRDVFGNDRVQLNITHRPQTITVHGSTRDLERAKAILHKDRGDTSDIADEVDTLCPVCWTVPETPYTTACQHTYCTDCFSQQCSSAKDTGFPITCFGNSGKCSQVIDMSALEGILSHSQLQTVLEASFTNYIHTHPHEYRFCPSPDCESIYRSTATVATFSCTSCLAEVCTCCSGPSHEPLSCHAYKEMVGEGSKAFTAWKAAHDVRDCPKCSTAIEKIEGCNHMTCGGCKTHICWFCMETFGEGAQCYTHMQNTHGNIYGV